MRMNIMIILALVLVVTSLGYAQYTAKDVLANTLNHYGIEVVDVGLTNDGAVLIYEQKLTTSPARILSDSTLAMVALADEYPNSSITFVITRIGGHPILLTYAKTNDVLAYRDGKMPPEEFAAKIYGKILIPEKSASFCCLPAFVLAACGLFLFFRR